ncbi:hypothetical protein ACT8ZV_01845 [Nocardioides sp. MAHUQ-72]|uniref:hypothetical protein n=1 Tax=unclassified Nocardioides TaxID=2615069 RepID=UPI00360E0703
MDGDRVRSVRLREADDGRKKLRLPRQAVGRRRVEVEFSEPGTMTPSRDSVRLRVCPGHGH